MTDFTCALPETVKAERVLLDIAKKLPHGVTGDDRILVAHLEREVWRGEQRIRRMMGGPLPRPHDYKQFVPPVLDGA